MIDYTKHFYNINLKCKLCNKPIDISLGSKDDIIFISGSKSTDLIHKSCWEGKGCWNEKGIIREPGTPAKNALKNFKPKLFKLLPELKTLTDEELGELLGE